jgi:polyisoprenoid-binding protein YceI
LPSAQYIAEKFTDKGKGQYIATGKLTLRNVTKDVPIEFTFEQKTRAPGSKAPHPSSGSTSVWVRAIGKTLKPSPTK